MAILAGMSRFLKSNPGSYRDALLREAEGLRLLAGTLARAGVAGVRVPQVWAVDEQTLELTRIESVPATDRLWARLGQGLAQLHRVPQSSYGLAQDNYIGLAPQPNGLSDNWGEFFLQRRLSYQASRIRDPVVAGEVTSVLERQRSRLQAYLNAHCRGPSLLHGDLWSGNVLFDAQSVWLIDPAVYCGDREADLAMTELFGGFGAAFYRAYDEVWPRSAEYSVKRDIYNLYHALNHYNLFGAGYLPGCRRYLELIEQL
ncbi:MAG: fructosamine kinase family protein [Marinobacter sp.]|uniref:fructosamine kinase family protein n=1 Tax=Marinobacter sp. TaxID=50741 RepID=UPI00299EB826|nr:fructosamine kinase family protein [Marinobacter sp.]MDX1755307.1 fructosamine kinase family protein [Marinobacter sp.]